MDGATTMSDVETSKMDTSNNGGKEMDLDQMINATEQLLSEAPKTTTKKKKNKKKKKKKVTTTDSKPVVDTVADPEQQIPTEDKPGKDIDESVSETGDTIPEKIDAQKVSDLDSSSGNLAIERKPKKKGSKQSRPVSLSKLERDSIKRKSSDLDSILVGIEEYLQTDEDINVNVVDGSAVPNGRDSSSDTSKASKNLKKKPVAKGMKRSNTAKQSLSSKIVESSAESASDANKVVGTHEEETNAYEPIDKEAKPLTEKKADEKNESISNELATEKEQSPSTAVLSDDLKKNQDNVQGEKQSIEKGSKADADILIKPETNSKLVKDAVIANESDADKKSISDTTIKEIGESNAEIKEKQTTQSRSEKEIISLTAEENNNKVTISDTIPDLNDDTMKAASPNIDEIKSVQQESYDSKSKETKSEPDEQEEDMNKGQSEPENNVSSSPCSSKIQALKEPALESKTKQEHEGNLLPSGNTTDVLEENSETVSAVKPSIADVNKDLPPKEGVNHGKTADVQELHTTSKPIEELSQAESPKKTSLDAMKKDKLKDSRKTDSTIEAQLDKCINEKSKPEEVGDDGPVDKELVDLKETPGESLGIEAVTQSPKVHHENEVSKVNEKQDKAAESLTVDKAGGEKSNKPSNLKEIEAKDTLSDTMNETKQDETMDKEPKSTAKLITLNDEVDEEASTLADDVSDLTEEKLKVKDNVMHTTAEIPNNDAQTDSDLPKEKEDLNEFNEDKNNEDPVKKGDGDVLSKIMTENNETPEKRVVISILDDLPSRYDNGNEKETHDTVPKIDLESKLKEALDEIETSDVSVPSVDPKTDVKETADEIEGLDLGDQEEKEAEEHKHSADVQSTSDNVTAKTSGGIQDILDETDKLLEELNFVDDSEINALLDSFDKPTSKKKAVVKETPQNTIKASDIIKANEELPVYIYTSLAGGGFHMIPRTNRLSTILTANRIKFEYRDLGTDDEARKVWKTYGRGRTLPGVVRGRDDIIGNWEEIEEVNENYGLRDLIYNSI
ncbi:uncharacterized protein HLK63_K10395 [Nakaseomyces glabratus]|nr:uncharacterized protein GW608_K10395 [Nakaseomyces glabratus]UCS27718.1 uncharacterized protein HLK63_K10395 [Nakaseomyces glabratus]UCS32947.1 uncharacterized protein HLK64_K10395 [Nakaseomyces glabratus]UCS38176.1 uncharacterized protein HLK62_K10395 [Nakaseomyces glabratus]